MARGGTGTYTKPTASRTSGTVISSTDYNTDIDDIATALTDSIAKDGQTTPTANLPMGTYRHTGVGNAAARTDYAATGQVQDGSFIWCGTAGGTKNALTLTPSPAITAYATGQKFRFKAGATQSDDAVTIAVSGLTTKAAQFNDAACSASAFIAANKYYEALYDGTAFQLTRLSTGHVSGDALLSGTQTFTGVNTFSAQLRQAKGADIASANPLVLGTDGNYFDVTGTTGFASITCAAGTVFTLQFDGACTITHGASINLPGGANITTAAGDEVTFFATAANTVRCICYTKADGTALVSSGGQVLYATTTTPASTATVIPTDNTIPQNTEGAELLTQAITPANSSSTIEIDVYIPVTSISASGIAFVGALFVDTTANALCAGRGTQVAAQPFFHLNFKVAAGSTSARTYKFRYGPGDTGTAYVLSSAGTRLFGGVETAIMRVTEILP